MTEALSKRGADREGRLKRWIWENFFPSGEGRNPGRDLEFWQHGVPVLLPGLLALALAAAPAPSEAVRYLSLGDSFTIGTGVGPAGAYPQLLAAQLRDGGLTVELQNPATNGYTTTNLIEEELPLVDSFKPSLVTLAIGANDIARGRSEASYRAALKVIFGKLSAQVPKGRVFALPQPEWSSSPVGRRFGSPDGLRKKIERFNGILKEEAEAHGAVYLDLWPLMLKQAASGELSDGLHPSAAAYGAWAAALLPRLAPALRKK